MRQTWNDMIDWLEGLVDRDYKLADVAAELGIPVESLVLFRRNQHEPELLFNATQQDALAWAAPAPDTRRQRLDRIAHTGVHQWADDALAEYRARLQDIITTLRAQGVEYDRDSAEYREELARARRAFGLTA